MAFSFRNLFKKEEEELEGQAPPPQSSELFDAFGRRIPQQQPSQTGPSPGFAGSPFAENSEPQQGPPALPITVPAGQIIPLLPQELVNPNGLAPDAMVRLPAAGRSGGIKVTEVYQACPALFNYAPDIRDTREIALGVRATPSSTDEQHPPAMPYNETHPPQTSTFTEEPPSLSPFAQSEADQSEGIPQPGSWPASNPFETGSLQNPFEQSAQAPPEFETGQLEAESSAPELESSPQEQPQSLSPFETGFLPAQEPTDESSGNMFDHSQNPRTSSFEQAPPPKPSTQELDASALPFAPAPPIETPEESGEIELSLLNILRGVDPEDLGFDAEEVPPEVRTNLPLSIVRPQLSSGTVVVSLGEIVSGCEERFHPAFTNSRKDAQVQLPLQEIFHNLPGDIPDLPSTAEFVARQQAEGAPIFDPTAPKNAEDQQHLPITGSLAEPQPEEVPEPSAQPPVSELFAPSAQFEPTQPPFEPAPKQEIEPEPTPAPRPSPAASIFESNEPVQQEPVPQNGDGLTSEQLMGSPFQQVPDQVENKPVSSPFQTGPIGQAPEPTPAPEPLADFKSFDDQEDLDQLALRAIFQVQGRLTPQDIVDLCAGLPGVQACVALHPGGAIPGGNAEAGFGEDAAGMFENVAGLARGLGIGEADTFTIRTRKGTFSFFSQGALCLGVLHDPNQPSFGPGIREKLVLVARELGGMVGR